MPHNVHCLLAGCCLLLAGCARANPAAVEPQTPREPTREVPQIGPQYHDYQALTGLLEELAAAAGRSAKVESLATTAAGRQVWLLTLATGDAPPAEQRLALLLVGGVDAEHPAGSEAALRVAQRLLRNAAEQPDGPEARLLATRTVYIIPRLNPDGVEAFFADVKHDSPVNARPVDDDRDGVCDEDGPNDLNGDGLITVMRVRAPDGVWLPDPDEPRLLRKADPRKAERGVYRLLLEGIDDDGDGLINEDGPGGVDDDRNWPHFYEPGLPAAGRHQLSEPETRALAEFVVDHPRIAAAVVYGRHDNLISVPKGKQRGHTGRDYRDLHPDDVPLYEHVGERFREITGLTGSPGCRPEGALYAWLYNQRGIPTFATNLWWPIGEAPASQPTTRPSTRPQESSAGAGSAVEISADDLPPGLAQRLERRESRRGARRVLVRRRGERGATAQNERREQQPTEESDDPLAGRVVAGRTLKSWLKYSDEQRGGVGFVPWTPCPHPTFGEVEVGGLVPYFRTAPPAAELDEIAARQLHFLIQLSDWLPELRFGPAEVRDLGAGLWQVTLHLLNDGYLPTHTAMARHAELPPIIVRPLVTPERIVGGKPLERWVQPLKRHQDQGAAFRIEDGTALRWLLRGRAGEAIEFQATHRTYGGLHTVVVLRETPPGGTRPAEEDR